MAVREVWVEQSPICEVRFAGFRATSPQLQQHGWEFACDQDPHRDYIQFAVRNPRLGVYGLSDQLDMLDFRNAAYRRHPYINSSLNSNYAFPVIEIKNLAETFKVVHGDFMTMSAVDMYPQRVKVENDIRDMPIFAPFEKQAPELIVEEKDVNELMQQILEMQKPAQERYREHQEKQRRLKEFRESQHPTKQVHGQIITLTNVA